MTRLSNKAQLQSPPTASIPTPDSTGIVANYDEVYPLNRWKDPITFVCTSQTVDESIVNSIAGGFTYYMDERDKEWLDKNNEEARGEGTSAQGALSTSNTRTSARSAKAKGKEPDISQPVVISEDEFELVVGVFEKVTLTHERTEYLHHVCIYFMFVFLVRLITFTGPGNRNGFPSVLRVPGRFFSPIGVFHIRKLFFTFIVTSPTCIFEDSENHLPVLEGAEDRAPWGSPDYTNIKRKCLSQGTTGKEN